MIKQRLLAALLALLALHGAALALSDSAIPTKIPTSWGTLAPPGDITCPIPIPSQIPTSNGRASWTDGFPPLTFNPVAAGGVPPFGQDFNGVLCQLSQWTRWFNAGAQVQYDGTFSSAVSGYPNGAILQQAANSTCVWISTTDNNTSDPDTGGANWVSSCPVPGQAGQPGTYYGGASSGTNAQTLSLSVPFSLNVGTTVYFLAGSTNLGPMTLNVAGTGNQNVFRQSQRGASMTVGGEIGYNQRVMVQWDGNEWQCMSCGAAVVGEVKTFASANGVLGWLPIDGSCQSRTTYADLFAVIGTSYANGNACPGTQFRLPDGRGQMLVGYDSQGSNGNAGNLSDCGNDTAPGGSCGQQAITLSRANLPNLSFAVATTFSTSASLSVATTFSSSPTLSVSTTDSGSVNIPSGQGSHTHGMTWDSGLSKLIGDFTTAIGSSLASGSGTVAPTTLPTIDSATLPAMSGTFSGAGSGTATGTVTGSPTGTATGTVTGSPTGVALSGGSGTAFPTIPPVQFATTMIKL